MERLQGLIGIILILSLAWVASNNKKRINYRLVISGILLQVTIAVLIFKVPFVKSFFSWMGRQMTHIEAFAKEGASFVYGGLVAQDA